MKDPFHWNDCYQRKETPWDSGEPSLEMMRILNERRITPCRVLELGCGTGTNAVYLARRGFRVTAFDLSPLAIAAAREKARRARVRVRFSVADALRFSPAGPPFPLVFDRGVYHHLRNVDLKRFLATLRRVTRPGGLYLTLAGNANDPLPAGQGPPTVAAHDLCGELGTLFELVQLREFRFDGVLVGKRQTHPIAWSALLRRKRPRR